MNNSTGILQKRFISKYCTANEFNIIKANIRSKVLPETHVVGGVELGLRQIQACTVQSFACVFSTSARSRAASCHVRPPKLYSFRRNQSGIHASPRVHPSFSVCASHSTCLSHSLHFCLSRIYPRLETPAGHRIIEQRGNAYFMIGEVSRMQIKCRGWRDTSAFRTRSKCIRV